MVWTLKIFAALVAAAICVVASGCTALLPAMTSAAKPAKQQEIINLASVRSKVDRSLQQSVAISFVPPQAMIIDGIVYQVDGKTVANGAFDLVLETNSLPIGNHIVTLVAQGQGELVRGTTYLEIIESGLSPTLDTAAAAAEPGAAAAADQPRTSTGSGDSAAKALTKKAPSLGGDSASQKAIVKIGFKIPDEDG